MLQMHSCVWDFAAMHRLVALAGASSSLTELNLQLNSVALLPERAAVGNARAYSLARVLWRLQTRATRSNAIITSMTAISFEGFPSGDLAQVVAQSVRQLAAPLQSLHIKCPRAVEYDARGGPDAPVRSFAPYCAVCSECSCTDVSKSHCADDCVRYAPASRPICLTTKT